jgi:hypothetical protein
MDVKSVTDPAPGNQAVNAVKLVADVGVLPGLGQLFEGKIAEGAMYGVGGLATKAILAPVLGGPLGLLAWVALGLDSYAKSSTGAHIWEQKAPAKSEPLSSI